MITKTTRRNPQDLDIVAFIDDRNTTHFETGQPIRLLKGQVGTVVMEYGHDAIEAFADKWDAHYPAVSQIWLRHWETIIPIFDYPMEIRRVIYTTNGLNRFIGRCVRCSRRRQCSLMRHRCSS